MGKWEGKVKGYDQSGGYVGTYQAIVEKKGNFLYKMTLSFESTYIKEKRETNNYLKAKTVYSSSPEMLKRKFRSTLILKVKSKVRWRILVQKD